MRTTFGNAKKFLRLLAQRRRSYPEEIQIEATNACNLQCAMCPHTHGAIPQIDFPAELFENLVRNNPPPCRLVLTGWGEPLMHPRFFDLVELANRFWPDTLVRFTTNGILLNAECRSHLASVRISGVTVSVDLWPGRDPLPPQWRDILHPASPKTFRNLIEYAEDRALSSRAPLTLQCLLVNENLSDVREYIRFAAKRSLAAVNLVRLQSYPGHSASRPAWEDEQKMIASLFRLGRELGVRIYSLNRQLLPLRLATHFDRVCLRTDDSVYITVDGTITPCCNLREFGIGSLSSPGSAIAEAWNSQREREFFANQSPVCGKCDALFHKYRT